MRLTTLKKILLNGKINTKKCRYILLDYQVIFITYNLKAEMDETRIMLEEQNEKNSLLERKFRKVDSELMEVTLK